MVGLTTAEEYRQRMRDFRAKQLLQPPGERVVLGGVAVLESDGFLRLRCDCRNYPIVDPVWTLACCFTCGRIYEAVSMPAEG